MNLEDLINETLAQAAVDSERTVFEFACLAGCELELQVQLAIADALAEVLA